MESGAVDNYVWLLKPAERGLFCVDDAVIRLRGRHRAQPQVVRPQRLSGLARMVLDEVERRGDTLRVLSSSWKYVSASTGRRQYDYPAKT